MTGDMAPKRVTRRELGQMVSELRAAGAIARVKREVTTEDGKTFVLQDGVRVGSSDGVVYRIEHMDRGGFTLRRERVKLKGKAVRREEKRRRRDAREYKARLELRRQQQLARMAEEHGDLSAVASEEWA